MVRTRSWKSINSAKHQNTNRRPHVGISGEDLIILKDASTCMSISDFRHRTYNNKEISYEKLPKNIQAVICNPPGRSNSPQLKILTTHLLIYS